MRPFHQTMCHCCQLIPLQITLPFIVSSLALSLSLPFSFSRSLAFLPCSFATPMLVFSLILEPRLQTVTLLSLLFFLVLSASHLSHFSPLSSFAVLFGSFFCPLPYSSFAVFLFRFHFVLLILLLPILRRPHRDTEDLSPWLKGAPGIAVIKEIVPISMPPSIIASIVCGWLKGATLMHSHAL